MRRVPKSFLEYLAPSLRSLELSYNYFTTVEDGAFRQLSFLQVLSLSHNNILDMEKMAFHSLVRLQILDLSSNKIEVLQFGQFSGLSGKAERAVLICMTIR